MSRSVSVLTSFWLGLAALTAVAEPPASAPAPSSTPPLSKLERTAAAAVQAPLLPPAVGPAPGTFVAPPLPGQLKAEPASAPAPAPASLPGAIKLSDIPAAPSGALKGLPPLPSAGSAAKDQGLRPVAPVPLNSNKNKAVSSTSSSGQFIVHGEDLALRSAFSGRCDEISASLRQLLRDQQPWVLPIVVLLKTGEAAKVAPTAVSYSISKIPNGGFHLQVNANVRGDLRPADLRSEVIRVLLAERVLRNQTEVSKRPRLLPDWVFTGVMEALDYRQRAHPSALFAAIFKSGKIYSIEEIIEASPVEMDALSKTIYQTSCCALVMALLDQPDGGLRLGKFLNSLASDARPERDLLNQCFPNFATTPASLNKWWSLQLASMASPSVAEPLSPTETLKQLEAGLTLHYKAKPSEIPRTHIALAPVSDEPDHPAKKGAEAAGNDEPNKKPSIFHRLNPFAKKEPTADQVIATAMKEAALAEAKASGSASASASASAPSAAKPVAKNAEAPSASKIAAKKPDAAPEVEADAADSAAAGKKPFMNMGWLFGSSDKKKAADDKAAVEDKTKLATEKKFAEEKAKLAAAEEKKDTESKRKMEAEKKAAEDRAKLAEERKAAADKAKLAEEKKAADAKTKPAGKRKVADPKAKPAEEKKAADAKAMPADEKKSADSKAKQADEKKLAAADAKAKAKADEEKKAESKKPEPKSADKKESKKAEPAAAEATAETKPASKSRLNWFRGNKKAAPKDDEKDGKKEEAPAEKKKKKDTAQNSLSTAAAQMLWAWSPLAADALMLVQAPAPVTASRQVEGFLGLKFGKKKEADSEEAPKSTAKAEPKAKAKEKDKSPENGEKKAEKKAEKKDDKKPEPRVEKKKEPEPAKEPEAKKPEPKKPELKKAESKKPEAAKPESPKPETPQPEPAKTEPAKADDPKHEPIKIKPLFGAGKKDKAEASPAADTPKEAPKTEAPPPVEKDRPKSAESSNKAARKSSPENEPTIDAAVPLEGYAAIMKRKDRNDILQHNRTALLALQSRASVLLRPIVTEYAEIVSGLMEGKTKGVDERLHSLRLRAAAAVKKTKAVRDFLDVYEANESPSFSGLFDDYLKLPETISKELPERSDPMSKYLDALDKEFSGH